ncbi:AMP-binding protein [Gordonia sp. X0973]|uniref:class I adenylate-forming enzyme family protein n=1 Tax=Gordonia sp. X0973 TaxID=2742602 RepID=UPI000F5311D8|nr:AMP-binding protein [Gordonia sp. X0973]QKT08588.1 AMP-binding protein [Gordonia sp. X0973]
MSDIGYFAWNLVDRGDAPCVRDDNTELGYAAYAERIDILAAQFAKLGVTRGSVVAAWLPNRVELLIALEAAWRLGATATPVNPQFLLPEAKRQIDDCDAVLVVAEKDEPGLGRPILLVDDFATTLDDSWRPPAEPAPDDIALLIYTSGSTGVPKGVELAHANLQYMGTAIGQNADLSASDHALLILPLFHVNAIAVSFIAPVLVGGQLTVTGHFSVTRFFADVARLRPTYFSAVPTIYAMLVSKMPDDADLSSLRFAICGAAPISRELLVKVEGALGIPILEGYGLTEGTCASACNPLNGKRKVGTVGPALAGQTIAIADHDGNHLPPGESGEVIISGPSVMRGYLNLPDATAATIKDGWLYTGDVGKLDEDGYLTLVDRVKDMIIRGGENIYPKEIENALAEHPAVLEAAVVGRPDDVYGEVPVGYVVPYPDAEVTGEELLEHLSSRLTRVKLPVSVTVVDALPRNPVGKIDKPTLRVQAKATP